MRSSATAEDLPGMSFAGQYDSVLNVVEDAALPEAVLRVWASLYSTRAVAYRSRHGIADAAVRMAVVVQRMAPAEAAGVLFTARKDAMIVADAGGGIRRAHEAEERRTVPALAERDLSRLFELARSVADLCGGPQDIEFAVAGGSAYLLQARPVTGVEPAAFPVEWEQAADATRTWTLNRFRPGPLYRLEEDALRAYSEAAAVCFAETGAPMARAHIIRVINGYHYARAADGDADDIAARLRRHVARAAVYVERGTSLYDAEIEPEVERILAELRRTRPRRASLAEAVAHLERAVEAYGRVLGDLHWRMAAANVSGPRDGSRLGDWPAAFREATGEPEADAAVFLQAIPNRTTRLIRELRALARIVQSAAGLADVFARRTYAELDAPAPRLRPAVQRFRRRLRAFLVRHGRRTGRGFGASVGFDAPTWAMQPAQPLDLIAAYARQDLGRLDELEAAAGRERRLALRRVRRRLARHPDRLARFERALALAVGDLVRMENRNHLMEQATGGALREAIARAGETLVRRGRLDHRDDVLHMSLDELRALAAGGGPADLRVLVGERAAERAARARLVPPSTLGAGGAPPPDPRSMYDLPAGVGRDGMLLRGVAASRGRVVGPARVVRPGGEPPTLARGDILVARNLGPDWTPAFPLFGGLVLDEGAVFQHAALVAREYRIPAVIMTRDATTAIREGQRIAVDGGAGVVDLAP